MDEGGLPPHSSGLEDMQARQQGADAHGGEDGDGVQKPADGRVDRMPDEAAQGARTLTALGELSPASALLLFASRRTRHHFDTMS